MAEREVAEVLGEIRERVRSQGALRRTESSGAGNGRVGAVDTELLSLLRRLSAQLETMERAQDRLPPVVSNRTGWLARLELWFKGHAGRATRWYAWEQVNFNRAVTESLKEISGALSSLSTRATESSDSSPLESRIASLELSAQKIERLETETATLRRMIDERSVQLRDEQRALLENLLDEQRVHLKQLALEIRETALAATREVRNLERRLDEITSSQKPS